MGIALETVAGTYVAPTKFFPINSETLKYQQDTKWRRPIRQIVDVLGGVAGNVHVEGDITMEALHDVIPYFHHCSRATVVKTGAGPYVYTYTPTAGAVAPNKTMSITVVRNGIVFGYVGVVVSSFKYTIEDGLMMVTFSMVGSDEAVQSSPTPTYTAVGPFGAGSYNVQIPTASQVFDTDTFEFSVDDSAEPQYRLKNTNRGAQFIKFGERSVDLSLERDFFTRTDYDAFKALTSQSITITATQGTNIWSLTLPVAIKDTYELGLSGQGDLIRAALKYVNVYDTATSKAYNLVITTSESIT